MSRDTDQHEQLSVLELQFKQKLVELLRTAADGQLTGVFASPRLQTPMPDVPRAAAQVLDDLASQIQRLQTRLDLTLGFGIVAQYLKYCDKWSAAGGLKAAEQRCAKEFLSDLKL
jgi:hypothetical protein